MPRPPTHCDKDLILLQPLRWCCVDCVIHHERDVREEQKYMYVARTSNDRVISSCDLYCCLLPRCEALCTCRSGFPIATIPFLNSILAHTIWKTRNKTTTQEIPDISNYLIKSFKTSPKIRSRIYSQRHKKTFKNSMQSTEKNL